MTDEENAWLFTGGEKGILRDTEAEEKPLAPVWRMTVLMIGFFVAAFIAWAAVSPVEEVAKSTGQVVPSSHLQAIQHLEGGIVREILVEEGQVVEKDQPLIRFDDTTARADLGQMLARQKALAMQAARLRSYAMGGEATILTPEERDILQSMEEARGNQMAVLDDQIAQRQKEIEALSAARRALEKNAAILKEEADIHEKMAAQGVGSKLTALASRREWIQISGQLEETRSQEKRARDALTEARNRLQSLEADLRQEAMKNLGQTEAELSEVNQTIVKLQSAAHRTEVTAPVRGIVKGLNVRTRGAVVESGKLLMEIVPLDEELIVEAVASPADIGNLKPGQAAKIKISAYDFARHGAVSGKLRSVSASTFQNEDGDSFYKMKIGLDQTFVGSDPKRNIVLPGMTVQADIITGRKTVLQYLLKPMKTVVSDAFYER